MAGGYAQHREQWLPICSLYMPIRKKVNMHLSIGMCISLKVINMGYILNT